MSLEHYNAELASIDMEIARLAQICGIQMLQPGVAEAVLRNTGLARYFSVVVTADDVELHKPNPDTFLLVASKLGIEPSGCLVFEDTGIGVQAGKAAGMQTCMVKEGQPVGITA